MQQNELYDIVILGASDAGIALCEMLKYRSPDTKIALVSKHFNNVKQINKLSNIDLITGESMLSSYNHGLIILTLKDRQLVVGKTLVIATGGKAIKAARDTFKNSNICYKPSEITINPKNRPAVVYGDGELAVSYALELSKKFKYVYLCSAVFKLECNTKLLNKLNNTANIVHLPNCHIASCKNDKEGRLAEVTLDTYETIRCSALVLALGRLPDISGVSPRMIELDQDKYIKINSVHQTTLVPNIYAIGECTKHNTKRSINTVCNHILGR